MTDTTQDNRRAAPADQTDRGETERGAGLASLVVEQVIPRLVDNCRHATAGRTPGSTHVDTLAALAIGRDAAVLMLHTYYALFSVPVMELREDGWFRFQYTPAGTAWAHRDHLGVGDLDLPLEVWEDRFLETGWVEFRNHGVSQPLRPSPNGADPIDTLIGPESFIEPLAFDGDWMQGRVTQPTDGCTFLPGARSLEGWMRWRSQEDGASLVWYPPKGC